MLNKVLSLIDETTQEIRLRVGQPIRVFDGCWKYMSECGIVLQSNNAIVPTCEDIDEIVYLACEKSVYAYNQQLINGYLTMEKGIRLGVCGTVVHENNRVLTIKDYSSIIMRIPHEIVGCSNTLLPKISSPLHSCLVVSPPAAGKTTLIRDIAANLGKQGYNCLICDERGEIASVIHQKSIYTLPNCDIYSGCSKEYCFMVGLRVCSPDVIICDEIQPQEIFMLKQAIFSGVCIIGSMHGERKSDIQSKNLDFFDLYAILSAKNQVGEIVSVFRKEEL